MTVQQLIEKLSAFDPLSEVYMDEEFQGVGFILDVYTPLNKNGYCNTPKNVFIADSKRRYYE